MRVYERNISQNDKLHAVHKIDNKWRNCFDFWPLQSGRYVKMYGHIMHIYSRYLPTYVFFFFSAYLFRSVSPRCSINVLRVHGFHFNDLWVMDTGTGNVHEECSCCTRNTYKCVWLLYYMCYLYTPTSQ